MPKKVLDFDDIPVIVRKAIALDLKKLGHKVVLISRLSSNPLDAYLYVVVAKSIRRVYGDRRYVVWNYNDSIGGLASGSYDLTYTDSLNVLVKRLV